MSVFPSEKNRKEKGTLVEIYPLRRKLQVFTFLCLNKKKERNLKLENLDIFSWPYRVGCVECWCVQRERPPRYLKRWYVF